MIKNKGSGLENLMAEIYSDLGYRVTQNVAMTKNDHGKKVHAQIDIIYETPQFKRYVECKYRKKDVVTLDEVAKFCAVLDMFEIPMMSGEIVTNTTFQKRAIYYAESLGVRLIDGKKLYELDKKKNNGFNNILYGYKIYHKAINEGIFKTIGYIINSGSSIAARIKKYTR